MTTKTAKTYCHPVLDDADARHLCARRAYGTTASSREYVVIWRGEHLALMRGIGHNTCRHIDLVDQTGPRRIVETMHVPGEDPRLTRMRVTSIIAQAIYRDLQWLEEQRAKEQKLKAQNEKRRRTYELANNVRKTMNELLRIADANVWEDIAVIAAARRYRKAVREHDTFVESC